MITVYEAARILGVNDTVIYTFVNDHDFPSSKIDNVWKINKTELEEWQNNVPSKILNINIGDNDKSGFANVPETAIIINIPLVRMYELVPCHSFPSIKLCNQWKVFKDKLDDWASANPVLLLSLQRPIKKTE